MFALKTKPQQLNTEKKTMHIEKKKKLVSRLLHVFDKKYEILLQFK